MQSETQADLVKQILENLRSPERLDDHPWTKSLIVQAEITGTPSLIEKSPGVQLAIAVSSIFKELIPATPPKQGKRLDTRWGEFGLLAAQYFAPFLFGTPSPTSMREAWGKIDQAILLFLDGMVSDASPEQDSSRYRLVGRELEIAPNSTISDWHRKGIERLTGTLLEREQHLSRSLSQPSGILESRVSNSSFLEPQQLRSKPTYLIKYGKWAALFLLILFILGSVFVANKAWLIYQLAMKVRQEVSQIQDLISDNFDLEMVDQVGPLITNLHDDTEKLRAETDVPLKWVGPWITWIPVYGSDISAAPDLLELADLTLNSARLSYIGAAPVVKAVQSTSSPLTPQELTKLLVQAQPQFVEARKNLTEARSVRARINMDLLSPKTKELIEKMDPLLDLLDDGLSTAIALPKILGASSDGPKTYMLLIQNEDELRATGGYLTSVGSFVIRDGELFGLKFENTDDYEDWTQPYPPPPWQIDRYMNIPAVLLRDANWSPDYPASLHLIEFLYAYKNDHSVDGVITFDQHALVILLRAIGPIIIQGAPDQITADNVIAYMREAKTPPDEKNKLDWDRKAFIENMASAILKKLLSGRGASGETLARALLGALNERHILLQFDDPDISELVARHAWDGAVRVGTGDFLMSVDTNIGYNKTNAVVEKKLTYDVDLSDLTAPTSSLVVFHENHAVGESPCLQWGGITPAERWYAINRCYYDYLRIYVPTGTQLIESTPHAIPAEWMMLGQSVPAQVDPLDPKFEKIDGADGFGTLVVVPFKQSLSTSFVFALPARVITSSSGNHEKSYTLKIQKQAGTLAIPLTIRIHLPNGAQVMQMIPKGKIESNNILMETDLSTDVIVKIAFSLP